jgi:hypothetical protein
MSHIIPSTDQFLELFVTLLCLLYKQHISNTIQKSESNLHIWKPVIVLLQKAFEILIILWNVFCYELLWLFFTL